MSDSKYKGIQKRIKSLYKHTIEFHKEIDFCELKLLTALSSPSGFDDKKIFDDYVMQDCDPLDYEKTELVSKSEVIRNEIREIQMDICALYDEARQNA